jgi:hypothetical protein
LGGFGLAGAGILAGSITGLLSIGKTWTAKDSCVDNRCPPSTFEEIDSARSLATISNVAFVVAGVGAGVGIVGLLLPKQRVQPVVGMGYIGAAGSF